MQPEPETPSESDAMWLEIMTNGHKPLRFMRFWFGNLPSSPRCKMCFSPFAGIGAKIARPLGFAQSRKNPMLCGRCLDNLPPGGAEVDIAVLFADVRGSTGMGETLPPTEYAALMNRLYRAATRVLVDHDALIDKLIGDEVMALFVPGVAGQDYRAKAVDAGTALLREVGYGNGTPFLEVGVGVHAGLAYVGNVGGDGISDITALGDTVNTAARLRSAAGPGEVVVSESLWLSLEDSRPDAERRTLELKGKAEHIPVRVLRP